MVPPKPHSLLTLTIFLLSSGAQAFGRFHARGNLGSRGFPGGHHGHHGHHGWPGDGSWSCPPPVTITATSISFPLIPGSETEMPNTLGTGNGSKYHIPTVTTTVTVTGPTLTIPASPFENPGINITTPANIVSVTEPIPIPATINTPSSQKSPSKVPSSGSQEPEPAPSASLPPSGIPALPITTSCTDENTYSESWTYMGLGPSGGVINGGFGGGYTPNVTEPIGKQTPYESTFCGTQTVIETVLTTLTWVEDYGPSINFPNSSACVTGSAIEH